MLLGIDIGTSFIKVSIVDHATGKAIAHAQAPEAEAKITSLQPGWAEQSPESWWKYFTEALSKLRKEISLNEIEAIGIAYQMHGLVLVDKKQNVLRDSIIWCDSRAVETGDKAFRALGETEFLTSHLNSPGNFTASKLAWVRENEPEIFDKTDKIMLPGDYIAMRLTGEITTTNSALSEGIFYDFQKDKLSKTILEYFQFNENMFPEIRPVFGEHGKISAAVASEFGLRTGIPVSYKAGDQLNNALSLNVMKPGEVAATAGTSGVIYAVTDQLSFDKYSRVNSFIHFNHLPEEKRIGVLLCINGAGIMNQWLKNITGLDYHILNKMASDVQAGANGLKVFPFGNGAERMLENKIPGASMMDLDLNKHGKAELARAVQEGIAFAFRYGLDIMRDCGIEPTVIRAAKANMFLSSVFCEAFVNATGVPVELYETDGGAGAAIGAGIGAGILNTDNTLGNPEIILPEKSSLYDSLFIEWKAMLEKKQLKPEV